MIKLTLSAICIGIAALAAVDKSVTTTSLQPGTVIEKAAVIDRGAIGGPIDTGAMMRAARRDLPAESWTAH